MSLFKQVFALLFLFLLLVIYCVYTHINDFETEEKSNPIEKKVIDIKLIKPSITSNDLIVNELSKKEDIDKKELIEEIEVKKSKFTESRVEEIKENISVLVNPKISNLTEQNSKIQKEINLVLEKKKIIFKRLSTNITDESFEIVNKIADILLKYPNIKLEVAGHTDAKGSDEVNEYISLQRAKSVREILMKYGIPNNRILAKGYGESMPMVENDKNGYSIINRRVEFNIIEE